MHIHQQHLKLIFSGNVSNQHGCILSVCSPICIVLGCCITVGLSVYAYLFCETWACIVYSCISLDWLDDYNTFIFMTIHHCLTWYWY